MNMARTKDGTLHSCMMVAYRWSRRHWAVCGSRGGGGGAMCESIYWKEYDKNGQMMFGLMMEDRNWSSFEEGLENGGSEEPPVVGWRLGER